MNKYKAMPRLDQRPGCTCTGCAGSFSDEKCREIANFIINSKKYYPSCVGSDGVIYVKLNLGKNSELVKTCNL